MSRARTDVRAALAAPDLPERVGALGFDPEDAAAVRGAAAVVLRRPAELAVVEEAAARLEARAGILPAHDGHAVWDGLALDDDGVLALLALLVTAPAVAAFHVARGIPGAVSAATLADLAQQVRVNRLVHGRFGLETYGWVAGYAWSGALHRLGRLQVAVEEGAAVDGSGRDRVLSVHVPRGGGLAPAAVDASLAAARPFVGRHLADLVPGAGSLDLHCLSWLLDPRLPELLPGSNLAAFQRRWRTYGEPREADGDALFFAFAQRGPLDPDRLVGRTALQRALLTVWRSGKHWHLVEGRLREVPA